MPERIQIIPLQPIVLRRRAPLPPPPAPELDAIRWMEDYAHGPSRPRTWRCWFRCPHKER